MKLGRKYYHRLLGEKMEFTEACQAMGDTGDPTSVYMETADGDIKEYTLSLIDEVPQ
ncbi:hypothetical protein LCGC14_1037180 [marine sediment metagenome]|uniref:Uncharacterized protein n=1 Tax=marine sediment metagenome TaxID=412755 RepID=A0A0F9NEF6_9ZZZZ